MRRIENLVFRLNEKGLQVRTTKGFPAGEFGTIYITPPPSNKNGRIEE